MEAHDEQGPAAAANGHATPGGTRPLAPVVATGTWVVDLDGVVWLAGQAIAGGDRAVARLRSAGVRVVFATNNAEPTDAELVTRLARVGIPATAEDLVTSAHAAADMVAPGSRVLAVGGPGLDAALAGRGVILADDGKPVDTVVVGMTQAFDYQVMARAALAVRAGARLIGTNEDPTHPTPEGLLPGSGALVAAVATAAQTEPAYAGKPHEPMADLLRRRAPGATVVVGDRPVTDGRLAVQLGVPFALVRSGVTAPSAVPEVQPDADVADLAALVDAVLGG